MISFNMIVKNEADNLKRLLPVVKQFVDEMVIVDTGSTDDTMKVAKELGANVVDYPNPPKASRDIDFAAFRNYALDHSKGDWIFWLDADDDVYGLENLKALVEQAPEELGGYYFTYNYTIKDGRVITPQKRERLFRKDKFRWVGRCHETAIPQQQSDVVFDESIVVDHRATLEEREKSLERNLQIMLKEYEDDKEKVDARTLYYIANTLMGRSEYVEAGEFFRRYLEVGGWDEERFDSWWKLSECLKHQHEFNAATYAAMEAIKLLPHRPEGHLVLGRVYHTWGEVTNNEPYFRKAIEWLEIGLQKEIPTTTRVINLDMMTWIPLAELASSYAHVGEIEKGYKLMQKSAEMSQDENAYNDLAFFADLLKGDRAVNAFLDAATYLEEKDEKQLPLLVKALPKELMADVRLVSLYQTYAEPKIWGDKDITIFCGRAWEKWADPSVISGIGGSEEAVVYLSRQLANQGYSVTVYNQCEDLAGTYKGVTYKSYLEFNIRDTFNIFISWRNIGIFNNQITAKKKLLWLHDVPKEEDYTDKVVENIDKILVLSKYHRSLLPQVADEKFLITNNGIVPDQFKNLPEKEAHTIFWGSSYDRGLACLLLDIMPLVIKEVPDVKLHGCYGWETFDRIHGNNPTMMQWKAGMQDAMNAEWYVDHGRVGHKELAKLMGQCTVWAYPTQFTEINCITAQKAQAAGCIPVTTNVAALRETNKQGVFIDTNNIYTDKYQQKRFARALIEQLKNPKQIDREQAIQDFSWEKTANQWIKEFNA